MEEYIENDEINERRKKQDYLITNIIQSKYDPEAFSEFLGQNKEGGQDIDNWNLEELETMVELFRRHSPMKERSEEILLKLEDIELPDEEKCLYARRLSTSKKKKTVVYFNQVSIIISNIEIIDGGLFYGKSLCFHIDIPQIDLKVRRAEPDFRWLYDSLGKEFPFIPLPPLLRISERLQDPGVVPQYKMFYEKFLNECVKHPLLKNSLALEIFLVCQSKEEMVMKSKELWKYYKNNILLEKYPSKKNVDSLDRNPLKVYPTVNEFVDLKLSNILKTQFATVDGQYALYEGLYEKIEKLSGEYQKYSGKLMEVNRQIKEAFTEAQNVAIKFNSVKEVKLKSNLIEDAVYGSISNYFENFGWLIR
jgi:hypothetical protein